MAEIRVGVVEALLLHGTGGDLSVLALRRAAGTRCTGAWESIHGRIEPGESPRDAALREIREETGLRVAKLYNVTCSTFYLHRTDTVQIAVIFAAFVDKQEPVVLAQEHDRAEWLTVDVALKRLAWPRSRSALRDALALLQDGDAGPVDDVLRVL